MLDHHILFEQTEKDLRLHSTDRGCIPSIRSVLTLFTYLVSRRCDWQFLDWSEMSVSNDFPSWTDPSSSDVSNSSECKKWGSGVTSCDVSWRERIAASIYEWVCVHVSAEQKWRRRRRKRLNRSVIKTNVLMAERGFPVDTSFWRTVDTWHCPRRDPNQWKVRETCGRTTRNAWWHSDHRSDFADE